MSAEDWKKIDWENVGINWSTVDYSGGASTSAATEAAVAPSAAKADVASAASSASSASTSSSSSSSGSSSSSSSGGDLGGLGGLESWLFEGLWNDLKGISNELTEFGSATASSGSEVSYAGNCGNPYGSVAMLVPSTDGYDYTITVKNVGSAPKSMNVWLKAGSDGQVNSGATNAPKDTTLTFVLPVGKSQTIAFAENVQGAMAESTDQKGDGGCFATAWLEFNTAKGWPAWDCSWIQDPDKSYPMYATAEGTDCVSCKTQASWMTDSQQIGSGDCALNADSAHITLYMGADPS